MHEFSVMSNLVEVVMDEARKHNASRVTEVHLLVGQLTLLGKEQLLFVYQVLSDNDLLRGSKLLIDEQKAIVRCRECGFEGNLEIVNDPIDHLIFPKFSCPKCDGRIEIIKGRECIVSNVKMVVED